MSTLERSVEIRKGGDSCDGFFLARAPGRLGDREPARPWSDRAAAWMDRHNPGEDERKRFRAGAAALLGVKDPPPRKEIAPAKP